MRNHILSEPYFTNIRALGKLKPVNTLNHSLLPGHAMNTHMPLRYAATISILLAVLALQGCGVRSISDSGYQAEAGRLRQPGHSLYKGELTEFEVLGVKPTASVAQEEIQHALENRQQFSLPKGSSVMLIQSGAIMPDDSMIQALEAHYRVAAFSGIPVGQGDASHAAALRLAAAKGNCAKILVYWGILETAQKDMSTKAVSWVPIVGGIIPDESQEMRIRLKMALIDVATGQWEAFSPKPIQDTSASARYTRASSDQQQVAVLKARAYAELAHAIVKKYAE
ncbi:MAG TPA: hypothetical protein VEZ52_05320 [Desulfovibrio sp.]|uniref:hypothetical protein n=1 Tax=Desulfovibrio sp. TaxID=885 RepID=UPI002D266783|nr:hypothetical protein [Desulfovibrio sp.]HZF61027.1 hypothetical protein [Desulfovibrio sp.]